MRRIYLDHNATTPVRPAAVAAVSDCLAGQPGNPSSLHAWGREAGALRRRAREQVAQAAGCDPRSVVFTSGGTEADNLALRGVLPATAAGNGRRPRLVTAATEHEAVLQTAEDLAELGCDVTILAVDGAGRVDLGELADALRSGADLVSLMAANNETGVLLPLAEAGAVCREHGVLFHTDAVQCFGKHPFRFDDLPVDLASISGHKIGGPKGVGALLVRRGVSVRPEITGGGQERGIRPGTENLPGIVGFGKAAEEACAELSAESPRLAALRDRLEKGLRASIPGIVVNGAEADRLPNTANVTFPGLDGESLLIALDLEGVAVSTGAACTAGAAEPSHVLLAMGRTAEEAGGSIRFSLGSSTTDSDIEEVLSVFPGIAARLASAGSAS